MSGDWDREDNSVVDPVTPRFSYAERDDNWYENNRREREQREQERLERRALRGYFVPQFMDREHLSEAFSSLAEEFNGDRDIYQAPNGMTHTWGANKLYVVCLDCGCIGYKLTSDISELQKCTAYNCRSRNIKIMRSGEVALAAGESDLGTDMTEVYNARRERLRAARAERAAQRRNAF